MNTEYELMPLVDLMHLIYEMRRMQGALDRHCKGSGLRVENMQRLASASRVWFVRTGRPMGE